VLVADVSPDGLVHVVDEEAVSLALGRELAPDRRFSDRLLARVLEVLEEFTLIARAADVDSIVAVGTAALRASTNHGALVRIAQRRLGILIEVVDGVEEARLAFEGALFGLPEEDGLLLDLGGGSIEVVEFSERRLTRSWSLPLGALSIADRFFRAEPHSAANVRAARRYIGRMLTAAHLPTLAPSGVLVGTGGSIRNLARMDRRRQRYPVARLQGYALPIARLHRSTARLLGVDAATRAATPGLNPERAHTILGGALVLEAIAQHVGASEVITAGEGLREGRARHLGGGELPSTEHVREAALAALHAPLSPAERSRVQQLIDLVVTLHRALDAEPATLEVVRDAAALLELGDSLDFYNRGSRASEVVLASGIPGFSHRDIARVAAVLRLTEREDAALGYLRPLVTAEEHRELRRGAAIVVLADALLRRTPADRVAEIEVTSANGELSICVPAWPRRTADQPTARVGLLFDRDVVITPRPRS
jgi:exopolyphosphatase/guanosine-5'-triphosphate,3'-diphosphate pyrophosphatase